MKNKRGFTLVELIAVIAILGVIITIATISITTIRNNINESQRENLHASIVVAAESYHEETGVNIVPVGTLLQVGKLKADTTNYVDDNLGIVKGDPVILDPVTKLPINCEAVVFKNGVGDYEGEGNIGCSMEAIIENALTVQYAKEAASTASSFANYSGNWIALENPSSNLVLTVQNAEKLKNMTWRMSDAPDTAFEGNIFTVAIPESGKVDMEITVSGELEGAKVEGVESDNSEYVTKTFRLKVDAKRPIIENYYVKEGVEWTQSKNIYADIFDNESGVKSYAIVKGNDCQDSDYVAYSGDNPVIQNVIENGSYTICAKDVAETTNKININVEVSKIDTNKPKYEVLVSNGTTYKQSHTFKIRVFDEAKTNEEASGFYAQTVKFKYIWSETDVTNCNGGKEVTITLNGLENTSGDITVNSYTGAGKIYVCPVSTVTDKAANGFANNIASNDMYLDNTAPTSTISIVGTETNYNNNKVKITVGGSDDHSKIKEYCYTTVNDSAYCAWNTSSVFNNVDTGKEEGSGSSIKYYAFTKDKAGNISSSSNSTYTLYTACTAKTRTGNGSYGSCSVLCGEGSKYRPVYYEDTYLGTECQNGSESTSCNTMDCCSSTHIGGSYCSGSCGTGTTVYYEYSDYDDSSCGTSYGDSCWTGGSCYTPSSSSYDTPSSTCDADCVIQLVHDDWPPGTSQEDWPGGCYSGVCFESYDQFADFRTNVAHRETNEAGDCTIKVTCQ